LGLRPAPVGNQISGRSYDAWLTQSFFPFPLVGYEFAAIQTAEQLRFFKAIDEQHGDTQFRFHQRGSLVGCGHLELAEP
jgi:hypothetical protein